jgi:hypothetical protein
MENFQDIFNLSNEDFVEKVQSKESELYKPNAKDGKDNVYKSLVRFIPWYKDPRKSKVKKFSYWLEDPLTGDGFSVDCPSTVNQKSVIQDTFWKLKKSPSVAEQKLSDKFKRRENYYALIQILKDEQRPELVGKIKVFKFGQKLNAIIQSELQPEYGKPFNPFDPMKGRPMALTVTISGGYNNYDQSKFVGDEFPCVLDGKKIEGTKESMQSFFEFLKTSSPDLGNYDFKEWDEELRTKVKSVIENSVPSMRTAEQISKGSASSTSSKNSSTDIDLGDFDAPSPKSSKSADLGDLNFDDFDKGSSNLDDDIYAGL